MVDPNKTFFNRIYDDLYYKVTGFVIAKCNDIGDVEDIVQEVFVELYSLIQKRGTSYINNTEAFVMQIAKYKIYKHYKVWEKVKNNVPLYKENGDGDEYEIAELEDIEIQDSYINSQTISEVWGILRTKTQLIQKIFGLYYYCDKTIKEIAKNLEISESMVKHKLYRTLEELRFIYQKEDYKVL